MTAEIAILNKSAVALAADSTVTIGSETKTYNTVNKLFTLSKLHPVGVMVYGDADFMDVPWESLIKQYRKHLGEAAFDYVRDYAFNFLHWLLPSAGHSTNFAEFSERVKAATQWPYDSGERPSSSSTCRCTGFSSVTITCGSASPICST